MSRSLGLPVNLHFAVLTKHKTPQVQILPIAADEQRLLPDTSRAWKIAS